MGAVPRGVPVRPRGILSLLAHCVHVVIPLLLLPVLSVCLLMMIPGHTHGYSGNKDSEGSATGALGGLLGALDAVNRGDDFTQLRSTVDVDAVIKEMAVQTVMLHQDR